MLTPDEKAAVIKMTRVEQFTDEQRDAIRDDDVLALETLLNFIPKRTSLLDCLESDAQGYINRGQAKLIEINAEREVWAKITLPTNEQPITE